MLTLPDPLHPAVVHFPIALLAAGTMAAVVAVVFNRWHLPWLAAILLASGSAGAFLAAETGEEAEETTLAMTAPAKALLEEHEEAAERTEVTAAIAAALAFAAAGAGLLSALHRRARTGAAPAVGPARLPIPAMALLLRGAAALAAVTACYFVYQTGHAGGRLVYEHGVGVKAAITARR